MTEFYTLETLGTLVGATGATVLLTNTIRTVSGFQAPWLGLLLAQIVSLGLLVVAGPKHASDWFIAALNGCMIFSCAIGAASVGEAAVQGPLARGPGATPRAAEAVAPGQKKPERRFWSRWL